jgi:enoyl-CoA hydratase
MYEHIAYVQDGPVTLIRIDRPERMNAIGPQTHRELVDAWQRFRDDDDAYVAVLTGAGDKAFSAGGDLKSAMDGEPVLAIDPEERAAHARGERPGVLGPSRWTDLYKPTIAAVNGAAYAGGLEWVCWTDLAIADQHATFGVTCRRWNIGLADGGTQRLPRIIGMRRAMELIITGRAVDAEEALRIGLANEVVPEGKSLERALELAHQIAGLPQGAIRSDKETMVRNVGRTYEEQLLREAENTASMFARRDSHAIGARAFKEARTPEWPHHGL